MSSFNNNNNINSNSVQDDTQQSVSPCSFSFSDPNGFNVCRVRLTGIAIKNLTLVEQKYLKQIAFNSLQKHFQYLQLEQQKQRKQLLNKTTSSNNSNVKSSSGSVNSNPFSIRLAIPKGTFFIST